MIVYVLSQMTSLHIKAFLSYFGFYIENVVTNGKLFVFLSLDSLFLLYYFLLRQI